MEYFFQDKKIKNKKENLINNNKAKLPSHFNILVIASHGVYIDFI